MGNIIIAFSIGMFSMGIIGEIFSENLRACQKTALVYGCGEYNSNGEFNWITKDK